MSGERRAGPLEVTTYSTSAGIYDLMVGRFAFEHWKENFERLEARYLFDLSRVADIACGTGLAAEYLARRGATVYAADLSEHMLREAARKRPSVRIRYMRQDMRYLQPPRRVSLLNCATDAVNHLLSEADVKRAFRSFRAALQPGGHAVFDMNTAWQLREGSDNREWDFEVAGQRMLWMSDWDEAKMVSTLSIVFKMRGDKGEDLVEVHRERAYDPAWVLEELGRAGFGAAEVLDAAGLGKPSAQTRRLLFVSGD